MSISLSRSSVSLASPAFTGTPTAPTAASGDNSTKIATTAYVDDVATTGTVYLPQGVTLALPVSSTVTTTNDYYALPVVIPKRSTITGIRYRIAATTNGNVRTALYSADGQTRVAFSGGTPQGTINTVQDVAFGSPTAVNPGLYWMLVSFTSITATFYAYTTAITYLGRCLTGAQGGAGVPATITPTADSAETIVQVPVLATY